ncbi:MAG: S24 family peptidase [Ferruginibacter sp.]
MSDFFSKNLAFLREQAKETQDKTATALGLTRSTLANYENGENLPKIDVGVKILNHFSISFEELMNVDLEKSHISKKVGQTKLPQSVQKPEPFRISYITDPEADYDEQLVPVPITDISVAAGSGIYNPDYITNVDAIRLPVTLLKKGNTYLCVKIKGPSMAPTLQDGGYVIIRLLDKGEWSKMADERVYVISDNEGKSFLKRVKNRLKQGFVVLRSDNPDQASFPSFNLAAEEINTIWIVEWYFTAKMPNIHDQYYTRLQRLEDKVEEMFSTQKGNAAKLK